MSRSPININTIPAPLKRRVDMRPARKDCGRYLHQERVVDLSRLSIFQFRRYISMGRTDGKGRIELWNQKNAVRTLWYPRQVEAWTSNSKQIQLAGAKRAYNQLGILEGNSSAEQRSRYTKRVLLYTNFVYNREWPSTLETMRIAPPTLETTRTTYKPTNLPTYICVPVKPLPDSPSQQRQSPPPRTLDSKNLSPCTESISQAQTLVTKVGWKKERKPT